ncbi:MAG: class I SAM-dependent methyltransferase [Bacteroidales bacterium]
MGRFRQLVRKIPGTVYLYRKFVALRYRFLPPENVFTEIYEKNLWGGEQSRSGPGSDPNQTNKLVNELPALLHRYQVKSMLDIPCGDFQWMVKVDLTGIVYHGADIVEPLIEKNIREYQDEHRKFSKINLLEDPLPPGDLILCRDCLVHLSYRDILLALKNISNSKSKYLLTTTFSARKENQDIVTGQWRPINLQAPPFSLPEPVTLYDEECVEAEGLYRDKMLALWEIDTLKQLFESGKLAT